MKHGFLIAAAALALTACNDRSAEQAVSEAANTATGTIDRIGTIAGAAGNAMDAAGEAVDRVTDRLDAGTGTGTPTAADFVRRVSISDMYEIEAARLAQAKSKSAAVTKYAGEMIAAHTSTTAGLKAIAAGDAILKPAAGLDANHRKMIADLEAATPETFDTLYVDQQTAAHQDAAALLRRYAADGDNARLKAFATETAPKVQHHLDMVKQIDHSGVDDSKAGNAGA